MPMREAFYGLWDVYSGPMHGELVLHDDGTYGAALWGGAQTHWGGWQIEDQPSAAFLVLRPAGSNPPALMSLYGTMQPEERHAVLNVLPGQIQLYDALMVRRFVAQSPPLAPAISNAAATAPPPAAGYFGTPVGLPSPAYSAPPVAPAPAGHATPIQNQWKDLDAATEKKITDIYAQIAKDDQQPAIDYANQLHDLFQKQFQVRQTAIAGEEAASHAFSETFTSQFIRR